MPGSTAEPWLPVDARHRPLAVDLQETDAASVLAFTRAFLAWRKDRPVLIRGGIRFLGAPEPVLAFVRDDGDEALLCAFNLGSVEMSVDLPAVAGVEPLDGHGLAGTIHGGSLRLPPHGGVFARAQGQGRLNRRLR